AGRGGNPHRSLRRTAAQARRNQPRPLAVSAENRLPRKTLRAKTPLTPVAPGSQMVRDANAEIIEPAAGEILGKVAHDPHRVAEQHRGKRQRGRHWMEGAA